MKKAKQREPLWARLFLAVVTSLNLVLTIGLRALNRQDTVKVVRDEDIIKIMKKSNDDGY